MSKKIKILTPRIYEHSDFFHNAVDFAREHSLNTNELCLELSHYLVDNFDKVWKIEKPRVYKRVSDLEAKLAERSKEIAIRNQKLNELKTELHKRDKSLERKKQQVGDVHKAVKQAKGESARKGRQVCYANNEVVQYQKQIKQQLAEKEKEIEEINKEFVQAVHDWKQLVTDKEKEISNLKGLVNERDKPIKNLKTNKKRVIEHKNNVKISFAVEQLEKVKEKYPRGTISWGIGKSEDGFEYVSDFIDNQIKELKKEMK